VTDFNDFLFQGNPPPAVTDTTNSQGSLPLWYSQYLAGLTNMASQQAAQPYQPYTGQMLAPMSDMQNQAFGQLQQNSNNWQQPMQQGAADIQRGANADPNGIQNWMNPYTKDVAQQAQFYGMRNLNENLMPALQNEFIGNGQFGSGIDQAMSERLVRDVGQNISNQQAQILGQGYNQAAGNYLTSQGQAIQGGQQLGALGQMQNQANITSAGALEAGGAQQQNLAQQGLNLGMQNFQNQQNYPWQQVSNVSNVLHGLQFPTSATQTHTGPFSGAMSPSPLAQLAGTIGLGGALGHG
jgi:hypothetical protein